MQPKQDTRICYCRCWQLLVFIVGGLAAPLQAQTPDSFNPGADYNVDTLALQPDGRILVGGSFGALAGRTCNSLGRLNEDGTLDSTFDAGVTGGVISLTTQVDGKIVVGGSFTKLGGQTWNKIGRLHSNGTLDTSFNPGANNTVYCLALQPDGKILVGGAFTTLGGQSRSCIGRLNVEGTIDASFNPGANSDVYSLAVQPDGKILVGGVFTTLGGQSRAYLGRLNANGSVDTTFNPGADSTVLSLALQPDEKILVGGFFATLGGQTRNYLGRLNGNGTLDTTFTNLAIGPIASNDGIFSLGLQADGKILAGGLFSSVGGQARDSLVRLHADGTVDDTFDAGASFTIYALAIQADGKILAGGQFTALGGQPRQYLGRLNNTAPATQDLVFDGSVITWLRSDTSPEVWRTTFEVSTNGTGWLSLGAGGRVPGGWQLNGVAFPTNASIRARGFTAGGRENGACWLVEAMIGPVAISQQPLGRTNNAGTTASFRVFAGGDSPLSYQWSKDGVNLIDAGNISGGQAATLIVSNVFGADAGGYSVIVSSASGSVTSLVATLGVIDPFIISQPANRTANAGQTSSFSVTAGGTPPLNFQWRKDAVELPGANAGSLTLTNVQWADRGNYDVRVSNGLNTITSAVATLTVNLTPPDAFNPSANGEVQALAIQPDGKILVGGKFTTLGGMTRLHLGRLNTNGTVDTTFTNGTGGGTYPAVSAIAVQPDGKILVGGDFTTLGGQARTNLGRLNADGTLDSGFNPGADGVSTSAVWSLALQSDGKILVGGWFTKLGGLNRLNIGRLNADGSVDSSFNPGANAVYPGVYSIGIQSNGKILAGGTFTSLGGQTRNRIGRLNTNGLLDTTFNPGAGGSVFCFAVQSDDKILVGGLFTTLTGQTRNNLGRLNLDGSLDLTFNPGASWSVFSLAVQADGKIVAGGAFTTLGGQTCSYLGRLTAEGTLDPTFNGPASGYVNSLALQVDGKILVGGSFAFLGGQFRNYLGRLNPSEPATQNLVFNGSSLTWLRGGTSPEIFRAGFDVSSNGTDWIALGDGARMSGGWQFTSVPPLTTNSTLRARGQVGGGYHTGSGWFVETTLAVVPRIPPMILSDDSNFGIVSNQFGFRVAGLFGQTVVLQASTNLLDWIPLQTNMLGGTPLYFRDADSASFPCRFYRVLLQ